LQQPSVIQIITTISWSIAAFGSSYRDLYAALEDLFPRKIRHIKPVQQKFRKDFVRLPPLIS
jgi:hypothetical protein